MFSRRERSAWGRERGARNAWMLECRRAQLPRTLGGGWERSTPWFLLCSWKLEWSDRLSRTLDGGRERSTPFSRRRLGKELSEQLAVENARRRQRTLYPLFLPKARRAWGSGAGSGSQTQRIKKEAGRRAKRSLILRSAFLYRKNCVLVVSRCRSVVFVIGYCGAGMPFPEALARRSEHFVRFREPYLWVKIYLAHRAVTSCEQAVLLIRD